MAITTIAAPSLLSNLAADPFVFQFSMSPVGSATEVRRFGYQLCDDTDEPISAKELIEVEDGETFTLNLQNDILPVVSTKPPSTTSSVVAQPEMEQAVRLKVFEHVFNKDTGVVTIENERTEGDYTVLNAANQYWGLQILGSGTYQWLNPMAGLLSLCRNRKQLIYLWSSAAVNIVITGRSSATGSDYTVTRTNTSGANSYTIDPTEIATAMVGTEGASVEETLPKIAYITVDVDGSEFVRFKMVDCCDIRRIAFQHSGGGYSFVQFDGGRELSAEMKGVEVYRYQDPNFTFSPTLAASRERGGVSIAERQTAESITLRAVFEDTTERGLRFLQDFLSSGSYYYEFIPFQGSFSGDPEVFQLVKFVPNFGSVKYHEEDDVYEMVFSGKIGRYHNLPNYAI